MEGGLSIDMGRSSQRKKLQLLPRSSGIDEGGIANTATKKTTNNPFGSAKPREEVLQQRGVDPEKQNSHFDKKAQRPRYTQEQQDEIEKIQNELTMIMNDRREANEMELPEETFRQAEDIKRKELNDVIEKFNLVNQDRATATAGVKKANEGNSKSFRSYKKTSKSGSNVQYNADDRRTRISQFSNSTNRSDSKQISDRKKSNSDNWRGDDNGNSKSNNRENSRRDRRHDDYSDNSYSNNSSDDDPTSYSNRRQRNTYRG